MGSFGDIIGELNIKPIKLISPGCPEWFPMTTPGNEAKAKGLAKGNIMKESFCKFVLNSLCTVKLWLSGEWVPDVNPESDYS